MNFKRSNQQPSASTAKPPPTAAVMDPGILEMGTSVSVNDEMRRAVAAEMTEIDAVCSKLTATINTESKTATELDKAQKRVDAESLELLRGATEATEAIHIDEEVLRGLATTFETELGTVMDRQTNNRRPSVLPPSPADATHNLFSIPNFNENKNAEIASYEKAFREATEQAIVLRQETLDLEQQARTIRDSIKTNGLQVALANAKYHNSVAQTDIDDEINREKEWTSKLDALVPVVAELEHSVPKMEQELQAKIQANAVKERELETKLNEFETRQSTDDKEVHGIEQEIALLDQQLEELEKVANEAKQLIAKRVQEEGKLHQERAERHDMVQADEKLGAEVASAKLTLNDIQSALAEEKKRAETISKLAACNDATNVAQFAIELEEKRTKQKNLESLVNEGSSQVNDELQNEVDKYKKERSELESVCASLAEENSNKTAALLDFERMADGDTGEFEEELQRADSIYRQEVKAGLSLKTQLEEATRALQDEEDKAEAALREIVRKAKVARYAARAIMNAEQKEAMVANLA